LILGWSDDSTSEEVGSIVEEIVSIVATTGVHGTCEEGLPL